MERTPLDGLTSLLEAADDGRLDALCVALQIDLLVAFGSAVEPRDGVPPRDLDLAVRFRGDGDLVAAVTQLISLSGCDDVDVMDLAAAGIVARAAAFERPLPLYERQAGEFTRASMAALVAAADTAWIRQLQLDRLAG